MVRWWTDMLVHTLLWRDGKVVDRHVGPHIIMERW